MSSRQSSSKDVLVFLVANKQDLGGAYIFFNFVQKKE